jgi:hypothetical protein
MPRLEVASPSRVRQSTDFVVDSIRRAAHSAHSARAGIVHLSAPLSDEDMHLTFRQVIVSLATLQSAVSDLSRAYIQHANTVLNRGPPTLETGFLTSSLAGVVSTGLIDPSLVGRQPSPAAKSDTGDKKKRKRAPHDPNAPKRALTPYFLYMQHNRAQIAQELGANAKPKDVADEGTRRWAEMPEAQKDVSFSLSGMHRCRIAGSLATLRCGRNYMPIIWRFTKKR